MAHQCVKFNAQYTAAAKRVETRQKMDYVPKFMLDSHIFYDEWWSSL